MSSHFMFKVHSCLLNYHINQDIASEFEWLLQNIAVEIVLQQIKMINLGNGLGPNRHQTMTWTNDDQDH